MIFKTLLLFLLFSAAPSLAAATLDLKRFQGEKEALFETATLTGFAGRSFQFSGAPGRHYVLLAGEHTQLVARFQRSKEGRYVTSYIDAMGLKHRNHTVLVQLDGSDELSVLLDGEPFQGPAPGGQASEYALGSPEPATTLSVAWQLSGPANGASAVILRTDLLGVVVFMEPGEAADGPAHAQPAFLNFDVALLREPASGALQGVIGETYARLLAGEAALVPGHPLYEEDDGLFHGDTSAYATASFFEALGGRGPVLGEGSNSSGTARRRLAEQMVFPLGAAGRTRAVAPRPRSLHRRMLR